MWGHICTHTHADSEDETVGIGMQLRPSRSDNQPWRNAPKPPPYTLTHTSIYLHIQPACKINWQACVCVYIQAKWFTVIAEPIVSSSVNVKWTCKEADIYILYRSPHTYTVIDTHTPTHPGPSLHSQSQIRWQIRRLILLGGRGIGVSPLLQAVPQDTYTHLTHTS